MRMTITHPGGSIEACAKAASQSYGKDLSHMSKDQIEEYVKKIWDKHTNISEHFVQQLEFFEVPRIVSMLMEFQRHVTFTEFSQRRRQPAVVNQEYLDAVASGEKLEDARKHLNVLTPSDFSVTLNREAARNIARILNKYQRIPLFTETLQNAGVQQLLADAFFFTLDDEAPFCCPEFDGVMEVHKESMEPRVWNNAMDYGWGREWVLPVYSFHEMIRHRTVEVLSWGILTEISCSTLSEILNSSMICTSTRSFQWGRFQDTRATAAVQEPLRSLARSLMR